VTVTPIPAFSVGLTGYFGNESTNPTIGARNLIDLVATWHVTDAFTLMLNYDNLRVKDVGATNTTIKTDGFAFLCEPELHGDVPRFTASRTDQG